MKSCLLTFLFFMCCVIWSECFIQDLYCGEENCYEILELKRESSRSEIAKAYRKFAKKWHPDRFRTKEDKEKATLQFRRIATAYEVLNDEDQRADYDQMLDNPEEYYYHYYRYYKRRLSPKVDIRYVIVGTLICISVIHFYLIKNRYRLKIKGMVAVPKYRRVASQIAKELNLINDDDIRRKIRRKELSKEDARFNEEHILYVIVEEKVHLMSQFNQISKEIRENLNENDEIFRQEFLKHNNLFRPTWKDFLLVQLAYLPFIFILYVYSIIRWYYRRLILKRELDEEEKSLLIRNHLNIPQRVWDAFSKEDKFQYFKLELWKSDVHEEWHKSHEEKNKQKLIQSGKYKTFRRWMNKGGPGQITFEE